MGVEWIPDNVKSSICDVPHKEHKLSATFIGNTTATQYLFSRITSQFERLYKRNAFLQWYINEGMDAMEFSNAYANVEDVILDYNQYQNATGYQEVIDHKNYPYKLSPAGPSNDDKEKEGNEANVESEGNEANAEKEGNEANVESEGNEANVEERYE